MNPVSTTRSESALVRPFAGIDEADVPLRSVRLLVDGSEFEAGPVVLPDGVMATAAFSVELPSVDVVCAAVTDTAVPLVDCGLVVIGTANSHRVSHVFVQEYLRSGQWPTRLDLGRVRHDLIFNDRAGFKLTVALVLLHDLAPEPLRPFMAGTWLARRDFSVSPEFEDTSFSPEPLTDEVREFLGLPKGVLRYVDVNIEAALSVESLSDCVNVYLDQEVLNLLLADPTSPVAFQSQIDLAVHATETVAVMIARELGEGSVPSVDLLAESPAAKRFYENLALRLNSTVVDVLELATNQVPVLRASLEAAFDLRTATSAALKEK